MVDVSAKDGLIVDQILFLLGCLMLLLVV